MVPRNQRSIRRLLGLLSLVLALVPTSCSGIEGATADLRARLEGIDLREEISGLTDCDQLSDTFISAVQRAADAVDSFAEATSAPMPISDIRAIVDDLAVSQFYELAERLGCARIQMELQLVERLLEIQTDSDSGEILIDEVIKDVQIPAL